MPAAAATFSVGEIILIIIAGIVVICCIHDGVKMFYYWIWPPASCVLMSYWMAKDRCTGTCTNPKSPLFQKQSRATQGFAAGHVPWTMLK